MTKNQRGSRRKDISSDLREAINAAHQSGRGYKVIFRHSGVHLFTSGKRSRQLLIFTGVDFQGQTVL